MSSKCLENNYLPHCAMCIPWKLFPSFLPSSQFIFVAFSASAGKKEPSWKANENLSSFLFSALFPLPCSFPPLGNYGFLIWAKGSRVSTTLLKFSLSLKIGKWWALCKNERCSRCISRITYGNGVLKPSLVF